MIITSKQNPHVQRVRTLLERNKARQEQSAFVVEGVRLTEEAVHSDWSIQLVMYSTGINQRGLALVDILRSKNVECFELSPDLFKMVSDTESSQGILAVMQHRELPLPGQPDLLVITDAIRDPGNLGTLLRTCTAAGVQGVLLAPGTTDAFAPKVVRSAMGAHFRLPILERTWQQIITICGQGRSPLVLMAADAEQGLDCWKVDMKRPLALVIGGEAEGISPTARRSMQDWVRIPMPGGSESLNAAVAAGILIFEIVRQRYT